MRIPLSIFAALTALVAQAAAPAGGMTALQALKLLPKDAWPRLARVEAFEGAPAPERWHILVHDTREENGLHEYVVANGEVVASRAISQFAEELKPEDIIGADNVKIDSDRVAGIAKNYAEANKLVMATCNYELKKDGDDAAPLWRVTCLDEKGEEVGQISVSATKGTVVRHEGFALEPTLYNGMTKEQFAAADAQWKKDMAARHASQATKQRVMRAEPATEERKPSFFGRIFGGGGH
jgi:hypothetical protein